MHSQLVVLGGGPGGYAAAFLAADLGMQVTIVERDPRLGGVCLLRGCIPSKALLHVAKVIGESAGAGRLGRRICQAEGEDRCAAGARKEKVIATLTGGLVQLAKRRKVQVVHAKAWFENSTTLRLERLDEPGKTDELTYDHCILATGSRPFKIPTLRFADAARDGFDRARWNWRIFLNRCW